MVTVVVARGQVGGSCRWAAWQMLDSQPKCDSSTKTTQISRLFSSILFCTPVRRVLCTEPLHKQPSEHVFVHDSIQRLHWGHLTLLILGFSIRIHASNPVPFRVAGRGP